MAGEKTQVQKTDAEKAAEAARKEQEKALEAQRAADDANLSPEQRKARDAQSKADDAAAKAEEARAVEREEATKEETKVEDAKNVVALANPELVVGDHHAQKFANTPENPPPANGLPELKEGEGTRLELTDSDHPDPDHPKVCYVPDVMVGDYLRAGWRRPVA
jgi:hypothetical protein